MRAEMNRLRNIVGDHLLASRPYRLDAKVVGDWLGVEASLAAGDLAGGLRSYAGPILPHSFAPGVERVRDGLLEDVHALVGERTVRQELVGEGHDFRQGLIGHP